MLGQWLRPSAGVIVGVRVGVAVFVGVVVLVGVRVGEDVGVGVGDGLAVNGHEGGAQEGVHLGRRPLGGGRPQAGQE